MNTLIDDTYRIVVGQDLEPTGDEALRQALELAGRIPNAELHVVHALAPAGRDEMGADARRLNDALVELRARVQLAISGRDPVATHVHVRFGEAVEAIVQVAVDYDASLVLVGTHRRTGLDRLRAGSVADRMIRTAPLPVLVAHAKDFAGHKVSVRPDPARPGEKLHHDQALTELVISAGRVSHIAGLV